MTCERKIRYESRMEAKAASTKGVTRPYKCEECQGAWHVGHIGHGTGLRTDARFGRSQVRGGGVYVYCPECEAFTARLGVAAAKCERCSQTVLPNWRGAK